MKKSLVLLCLGAASVLSLAGCGNKGNNSDSSSKTLTVATSIDITTLTPTNGNSSPKTGFYYNLYESLFDLDANGALHPDIAKSINITGDKEWEVELFDGVKDSAGNAITADDVVASINWLKVSGNSVNYTYYDKVEKVSDTKVKFTWTEKPASMSDVEFPLARTFIVDSSYFSGTNGKDLDSRFGSDPITSGNYKVKKFASGSYLTLEKVSNYWADSCTDPEVANRLAIHNQMADEITFQYVSDANVAKMSLLSGDIDYCDYIKDSDLATFKNNSKYTVVESVASTYTWLGFNMDSSSPFASDINLRLAVSYAIDSEEVASVIPGSYLPMKTYATEYFTDEKGYYQESWTEEANYSNTFSLEKAKEYLAKSSFDTSKEIKIYCKSSTEDQNAAQKIQMELMTLGLNVKIYPVDSTAFQTDTADASKWDIVLFSGMGGANLVATWQLALSPVNGDTTLTFNTDQTLFDKYTAAKNNTSASTIKDVIDYNYQQCYIYPLCYAKTSQVFDATKISSVYYREGYASLCASTFVGQTENKDPSATGWTIPKDGTFDAALAGTYTFEDTLSYTTAKFTLELKADGSYRLDAEYKNGEHTAMIGDADMWYVNSDSQVVLEEGNVITIAGSNDRIVVCEDNWAGDDQDHPQISVTLDQVNGTFLPVGHVTDHSKKEETTEGDPGIVTALKGAGWSCETWTTTDYGNWYFLHNDAVTDTTDKDYAAARLVVAGLDEISEAGKSEYVYEGTFAHDGPNFIFTPNATQNDPKVVDDYWDEAGTFTWTFDSDAKAFVPAKKLVDTPFPVKYMKGEGMDVIEVNQGATVARYWLVQNIGGEGNAKLFIATPESTYEYDGTFTHDGPTFVFTLAADNTTEKYGTAWTADNTLSISFDADSHGWVVVTPAE